jgi:SAM-dependent methyltransferase
MPSRTSVFDSIAELYDRARPSYPDALVDDLIALAAIPEGGRVLEIGCGTGKLTLPLAKRGYRIDAIELGPSLAAVARRNLAAYTNVAVHNAAFEEWPLPSHQYDLAVSATAFHWIDPSARFTKTADALRPGGALAIIETQHVAGGDETFFNEVQACYEAHDPTVELGLRLQPATSFRTDISGPGAERFASPDTRRYDVEIPYTTGEYIDVLHTYSGHIELPAANQRALYSCIRSLLDGRYGGRIRKQYLFLLAVAGLRA